MHKITKINNETHEVELTHTDGSKISFTIPEHARGSEADRIAHIKSQMVTKKLISEPAKVEKIIETVVPSIIKKIIIVQTIIILLLIAKVIHG